MNIWGLPRETLRYYEEIGLIKPKRGQYSRYREFDLFDMSRLMAIDFYKKRGFSPVAIKGMLEAEQEEYAIKLQQQSDSLQEQIDRLSQMQKASEGDTAFFIRSFPRIPVSLRSGNYRFIMWQSGFLP